MYSISDFSKLTGLSPRTLRFYEEKGLLNPRTKEFSNHRLYGESELNAISKIQFLKKCDFSIKEIQEFLISSSRKEVGHFKEKVAIKRNKLIASISKENEKLNHIENLLDFLTDFEGQNIEKVFAHQEKQEEEDMSFDIEMNEFIKQQGLTGQIYDDYLKREEACYDTKDKKEFFQKIKKVISFAREKNIEIGFLRGGAANSFFLFQQGLSVVNPVIENLYPERWINMGDLDLWFDAEFSKADLIKDYIKSTFDSSSYGEITVFKSPIIEIIKNAESRLGERPRYEDYDFNSDFILRPYREGNLEYIFGYDLGNSVIARMEKFELDNEEKYISGMNISKFSDVMAVMSLVCRDKDIFTERKETYLKATYGELPYKRVSQEFNELLSDTYGMLIFQEDAANIIHFYTEWEFGKCDKARRVLGKRFVEDELYIELKSLLEPEVIEVLEKESPYTFCKAHLLSERELARKTIVLRELHKEVFIEEIKKFEKEHGVPWSEIGFKSSTMNVLC